MGDFYLVGAFFKKNDEYTYDINKVFWFFFFLQAMSTLILEMGTIEGNELVHRCERIHSSVWRFDSSSLEGYRKISKIIRPKEERLCSSPGIPKWWPNIDNGPILLLCSAKYAI